MAQKKIFQTNLFKLNGLTFFILLLPVSVVFGEGPSVAFKFGAQTIESPIDLSTTTETRLELDIGTQRFLNGYADMAFAVGGSPLGTFRDYYEETIDDVFIQDDFVSDLALIDVRLAARLYPLGPDSAVQPYIGAGLGYYWFYGSWTDTYSETYYEDPPGAYVTYTDVTKGTDVASQGIFPFVLAGINVPINSYWDFMFEFEYDFNKIDSGFDFSGPIYMIGFRYRIK
jgi:hypothetical protein